MGHVLTGLQTRVDQQRDLIDTVVSYFKVEQETRCRPAPEQISYECRIYIHLSYR